MSSASAVSAMEVPMPNPGVLISRYMPAMSAMTSIERTAFEQRYSAACSVSVGVMSMIVSALRNFFNCCLLLMVAFEILCFFAKMLSNVSSVEPSCMILRSVYFPLF